MNQTLISRSELAKRWGVDATTIDTYEREGVIKRVFDSGWPKYYIGAIEIIEAGGKDNVLTRLRTENEQLRKELEEKNRTLDTVRRLLI